MSAPTPMSLTMILCDSVIIENETYKASIIGAHDSFVADQYPALHRGLAIFVELVDGHGKAPLTLSFGRITAESLDGDELFTIGTELDFPDPRQVVRMVAQIRPLALPAPGEYRFFVRSGGAVIVERRFLAIQGEARS